MGTKSKGRTPEAQHEIPGVLDEVVSIAPLTRACRRLVSARAEYQKAGMDAKEAGDKVRTLMHEHADKLKNGDDSGKLTYRFKGGVIELEPAKEKLKVTMGDSEDEGEILGSEA